jgi:hypothetical protein
MHSGAWTGLVLVEDAAVIGARDEYKSRKVKNSKNCPAAC